MSPKLLQDLAKDEEGLLPRTFLAHESAHVLQHQHFDALNHRHRSSSIDALLASKMILEGEAEYVAIEYALQTKAFFAQQRFRYQMVRGASSSDPDVRWVSLQNQLITPRGQEFIEVLVDRSGWNAVAALHESRPPETSAQVLHPSLYLDQIGPEEVSLRGLAVDESVAFDVVAETRLGELFAELYLADEREVTLPEENWRGDDARIYAFADQCQLALVWLSVWSTPELAAQQAERAAKRAPAGRADAYLAHHFPDTRALLVLRNVAPSLHKGIVASVTTEAMKFTH